MPGSPFPLRAGHPQAVRPRTSAYPPTTRRVPTVTARRARPTPDRSAWVIGGFGLDERHVVGHRLRRHSGLDHLRPGLLIEAQPVAVACGSSPRLVVGRDALHELRAGAALADLIGDPRAAPSRAGRPRRRS
jgi:hypothetical protein